MGTASFHTDDIMRAARALLGVDLSASSVRTSILCDAEKKYPHYAMSNIEALHRWSSQLPSRVLDWSLGYPILVCDDRGEYVVPDPSSNVKIARSSLINPRVRRAIRSNSIGKLEVCTSNIDSLGVFAAQRFRRGQYVGPYGGTVMTEEEWESTKPDGQFIFVVHHGAYGVVVDGECGPVNALKYLNHSCDPNVRMVEVFEDGRWHVAVLALKDITTGCELTHDYGLTTEDEDDPALRIRCSCRAECCRGNLVALRVW